MGSYHRFCPWKLTSIFEDRQIASPALVLMTFITTNLFLKPSVVIRPNFGRVFNFQSNDVNVWHCWFLTILADVFAPRSQEAPTVALATLGCRVDPEFKSCCLLAQDNKRPVGHSFVKLCQFVAKQKRVDLSRWLIHFLLVSVPAWRYLMSTTHAVLTWCIRWTWIVR